MRLSTCQSNEAVIDLAVFHKNVEILDKNGM